MDFGRILTRAWEITWRWKVLWILGILAGLGNGANGSNSIYRFSSDRINANAPNINFPAYLGPVLVGLICVAFIVGLVLWVLSVMARGGLIAGVAQVEDTGATTLGRAWAVGQRRFWTLFGIGVLTSLPIIALVLLVIFGSIALFVPWFTVVGTNGGGSPAGQGALATGLIACLCGGVCLTALLALALGQIRIYAERAAILEELNWTSAFSRGWQVLRDHLGPTIVLWLIFIVLALIVGVIVLIVASPIVIPLVLLGQQAQSPEAIWPLICGAGLIALVVGAIISSVVEVFTSATWTLAYRSLTGVAPLSPAAPPPGPVAPPPERA